MDNTNERVQTAKENNSPRIVPDIESGVQKRRHGASGIRYFSMFSGIGGFEKGIEDAFNSNAPRLSAREEAPAVLRTHGPSLAGEPWGHRASCIGFSEIDKNAINIYKKHYPGHRNYGSAFDIKTADLPDFDILVGGFPCQAFSIAGKRLGFDDTRGTLFFEIARILREKRPGQFLLENVKGLLSHDDGKTFRTIISTLAEMGYCVEWEVLNSKNFGVPQNRERVFIHGFRDGCGRQIFPLGSTDCETNIGVKIVAHKDGYRRNSQTFDPDGITEALDTAQGGGRGHHTAIRINNGVAEETKDESLCIDKSYGKGFDNHGQRTGIFEGYRIRRLTPRETERLQGFPDDWTKYGADGRVMSDSARYKACGNAVTTNVIKAVIESMYN